MPCRLKVLLLLVGALPCTVSRAQKQKAEGSWDGRLVGLWQTNSSGHEAMVSDEKSETGFKAWCAMSSGFQQPAAPVLFHAARCCHAPFCQPSCQQCTAGLNNCLLRKRVEHVEKKHVEHRLQLPTLMFQSLLIHTTQGVGLCLYLSQERIDVQHSVRLLATYMAKPTKRQPWQPSRH